MFSSPAHMTRSIHALRSLLTPRRVGILVSAFLVLVLFMELRTVFEPSEIYQLSPRSPRLSINLATTTLAELTCPICVPRFGDAVGRSITSLSQDVPQRVDVGIVSVRSDDELGLLASASKYIFAHHQGHTYYDIPTNFFENDTSYEKMRLIAISKVLEKHQWALWIGGQDVVTNFNLPLGGPLNEATKTDQLNDVIAPYPKNNRYPFLMMRRCTETAVFLKAWENETDPGFIAAFKSTSVNQALSTLFIDIEDYLETNVAQQDFITEFKPHQVQEATEAYKTALKDALWNIENLLVNPELTFFEKLVELKANVWSVDFDKWEPFIMPKMVKQRLTG